MKVFVTGATGFVGSHLIDSLLTSGIAVTGLVRRRSNSLAPSVTQVVADLGDLKKVSLHDIDVVVHAAARVHVMQETSLDPLSDFRKVNVDYTVSLAKMAASHGVKRFVFISSVKVNGENTNFNEFFTPSDDFIPSDPYGLSKYEAERQLLDYSARSGLEVVIIRPALVYGVGVKGNFSTLINVVRKSIPLPFRSVCNKRSYVSLDNLVDLIKVCLDHPKANNKIFMASDGLDISTALLIHKVAFAYGVKTWLFPLSLRFMRLGAKVLNKQSHAARLLDDLRVDSSACKDLLDWVPPETMDHQLYKMAAHDKQKS